MFRVNSFYVNEVFDDSDEGFGGSAEIGFILNGGHSISQIIGFEIGYIYSDAGDSGIDTDLGGFVDVNVDTQLIPFFLNLTLVSTPCDAGFFWEFGGGLGGVYIDKDISVRSPSLSGTLGDDDTLFGGQVFTRFGYAFCEQSSVHAGLRYMLTQKDDLLETRALDTFAYELSYQIKF